MSSNKKKRRGGGGADGAAGKKTGSAGDQRDLIRIKITSCGEGGVGKSCIIKRYCEEKFVTRYIATIGVDFGVKPIVVQDCDVKVNFWDLSGHPEFFDVRNEFYKDTQGVILCFDVSQRVTFQALDKWVKEAQRYGVRDSAVWALCANKVDKKTKRAVTRREAELWAERSGFQYFETSAKTGEGIDDLFNYLFLTVVGNLISDD